MIGKKRRASSKEHPGIHVTGPAVIVETDALLSSLCDWCAWPEDFFRLDILLCSEYYMCVYAVGAEKICCRRGRVFAGRPSNRHHRFSRSSVCGFAKYFCSFV